MLTVMQKATVQFYLFLLFFTAIFAAERSFAQSNQEIADSLQANINLAQKDTNTVNSISELVWVLVDLNQNESLLLVNQPCLRLAQFLLQLLFVKKKPIQTHDRSLLKFR